MDKVFVPILAAALLSGCAAGFVPTPDVELAASAGVAIGVPSTELAISNVKRDLGAMSSRETFDVRTRAGVAYGCVVARETLATSVKADCRRK